VGATLRLPAAARNRNGKLAGFVCYGDDVNPFKTDK
jgi:hypothetical protein